MFFNFFIFLLFILLISIISDEIFIVYCRYFQTHGEVKQKIQQINASLALRVKSLERRCQQLELEKENLAQGKANLPAGTAKRDEKDVTKPPTSIFNGLFLSFINLQFITTFAIP
jgi:hypothetical protein